MSKESMIYLSKFANLMRKILYNSQNYTVPLNEEIELLKSYCELEALRLENRFDFKIDIDKNINSNVYKIPVFLLQPLIENAIKHGIESIDNNGIISLKVMEHNGGLKCRIEDNGIGNSAVPNLNKKDEHLSLAGKLIQKRLDILSMYYKKKFEFIMKDIKTESGDVLGFVSEITLPIIE